MKNLLEELENNEAILLMFLAGELPAEDHAEVEQMLARDAGMRGTLDELRVLHGQMNETFVRLDSAASKMSDEASIRRASRAMSQALSAQGASRPMAASNAPQRALRIGWLVYPAAAAAAIVVGAMLYMNQAPTVTKPGNAEIAILDVAPPAIFPEETQTEPVRSQLASLEAEAMSLSSAARLDDDTLGLRNDWER